MRKNIGLERRNLIAEVNLRLNIIPRLNCRQNIVEERIRTFLHKVAEG